MYQVYVNGELFGTSESPTFEYRLSSPAVNVELNKAGSFECVIYPGHAFYDRLIKMKSYVEVYQNNHRIFRGRLLRTEVNASREKSCYFEGELSYLLDSVQLPREHEESVANHFKRIIETHNSQVDYEKRFEIGSVTVDDADTVETFEEINYSDTFSLLQSTLIDHYGGYLWIRDFGGVKYLDYVKDYNRTSSQDMEFQKNVIDITDNISGEDIFTVLLPLGPTESVTDNDGTTTTIMTVESVNGGSIYLVDDEMVNRHGWIVKTQSFESAESPSDLLIKAKKYKEEHLVGLPETISVKAIDLNFEDSSVRPIQLGDKVTIYSRIHDIRKDLTCINIEYNLNQPWESTYEFGTPIQDLSERYASTASTVDSAIRGNNTVINQMNSVINKQGQDIIVNARDIEVNARDILVNARNIEVNAEEITLRAKQTQVDEIHNRTTNLEAEIVVQAGEIALRATKEQLDYVDQKHTGEEERLLTRLQAAEIRIGNGEINMETLSANLYGEIDRIDRNYETLSKEVDEVGESVSQAFIKINANEANIKLKADSTVVDNLGRRVTSAEVDIDALEGQVELKVNKNGVIAAIRVSSETVQIQASKINLSGYVTASSLQATDAKIDNLMSGNATASRIQATHIQCNSITIDGKTGTWKSITINGVSHTLFEW